MKSSDARDPIHETDWITTHQHPTRSERERAGPHTIPHQATKDGKEKHPSQREISSLEKPRNLRLIFLFQGQK